jgi:hypothetical protein
MENFGIIQKVTHSNARPSPIKNESPRGLSWRGRGVEQRNGPSSPLKLESSLISHKSQKKYQLDGAIKTSKTVKTIAGVSDKKLYVANDQAVKAKGIEEITHQCQKPNLPFHEICSLLNELVSLSQNHRLHLQIRQLADELIGKLNDFKSILIDLDLETSAKLAENIVRLSPGHYNTRQVFGALITSLTVGIGRADMSTVPRSHPALLSILCTTLCAIRGLDAHLKQKVIQLLNKILIKFSNDKRMQIQELPTILLAIAKYEQSGETVDVLFSKATSLIVDPKHATALNMRKICAILWSMSVCNKLSSSLLDQLVNSPKLRLSTLMQKEELVGELLYTRLTCQNSADQELSKVEWPKELAAFLDMRSAIIPKWCPEDLIDTLRLNQYLVPRESVELIEVETKGEPVRLNSSTDDFDWSQIENDMTLFVDGLMEDYTGGVDDESIFMMRYGSAFNS